MAKNHPILYKPTSTVTVAVYVLTGGLDSPHSSQRSCLFSDTRWLVDHLGGGASSLPGTADRCGLECLCRQLAVGEQFGLWAATGLRAVCLSGQLRPPTWPLGTVCQVSRLQKAESSRLRNTLIPWNDFIKSLSMLYFTFCCYLSSVGLWN